MIAYNKARAANMYAQEHFGRGDTDISGKRGLFMISVRVTIRHGWGVFTHAMVTPTIICCDFQNRDRRCIFLSPKGVEGIRVSEPEFVDTLLGEVSSTIGLSRIQR